MIRNTTSLKSILKMLFFYFSVLLSLVIFAGGELFSQVLTTRGKEYWLGFLENLDGRYIVGQDERISVFVSSRVNTTGTISIPIQGFSQNFNVPAGTTIEIKLPLNSVIVRGSDIIQGRAVHVVTKDSVNVYGLNYKVNSEDASVILPINTLREDYYLLTYSETNMSEFMIVATEDNTQIEITPTADINNGSAAGQKYTITLNKGEVYQGQSDSDLSGTRITAKGTSCKRFAVFGGANCTNVGFCGRCDHIFEQMFPINTWGYTYIVIPLKNRIFDRMRIIAAENGTTISINGNSVNLNAGQSYDQQVNEPTYIKSNKPILVAQLSVGGCCEIGVDCTNDPEIYADPFLLLVSSVEQMAIKNATISSFNISNIDDSFINIVTKTNAINLLKVDGQSISGQFLPLPNDPQYSYARLTVQKGNHSIVSDSGLIAYVYGFGERDSYGYSGDVVLNNIALQIVSVDKVCVGETINFRGKSTREVSSWDWDFGNGKRSSGQTTSTTYSNPGLYTVKLFVQREGSNCPDTTIKEITVTPSGASPDVEPGTITKDQTLCAGKAAEPLILTGQKGEKWSWEFSNDGQNWISLNNDNKTFYTPANLTPAGTTFYYRIKITEGKCIIEYSSPVKITVESDSEGGSLTGSRKECAKSVSPDLKLTGYGQSSILQWESSIDGGDTWNTISGTTRNLKPTSVTQTTSYRVKLKNGNCGEVYSNEVKIELTPPSEGGILSGPNTVCSGVPIELTLRNYTGRILRWESSTDEQNWTNQNNADKDKLYKDNLTKKTTFRVIIQNGECEQAISETLEIISKTGVSPGILSGGKTVCSDFTDGDLKLTGHQGTIVNWEQSFDSFNWTPINVTSSTFNPKNITRSTQYRVALSSDCGDAKTNIVKIDITPPTIPGILNKNDSICSGEEVSLKIIDSRGDVIKWESSTDSQNWKKLNTSATTTLNIDNISATTYYRAMLKNGDCESEQTNSVKITVLKSAEPGVLSGEKSLCSNIVNTDLSITGFSGKILNWEKSENESGWVKVENTANTLSTGNLTTTTSYRVVIKGECGEVFSNVQKITLTAPSKGGIVSPNATWCSGQQPITLKLNGAIGRVLKWEKSPDGQNWSDAGNAGVESIQVSGITQTMKYRAVIQNENCPIVASEPATVTAESGTVTPGMLKGGVDTCASSINTELKIDKSEGIEFWESSTNGGNSWNTVPNINPIYKPTELTKTTWFRVSYRSGVCAQAYSNVVKVIINPPSVGGRLLDNQNACLGEPINPLKLTSHSGIIIQWEQSNLNPGNWSVIPNVNSDTYTPNNISFKTYFRVKVQNGECPATYSTSVYVNVSEPTIPGIVSGSITACFFALPNLILSGHRGQIIRWEYSTNGGGRWDGILNRTTAYSPDTVKKTTWYRAVIQNGGCNIEYSAPAIVEIKDFPKGSLSISKAYICQGEKSPKITLSDFVGDILGWQISKDNRRWINIGKAQQTSYTPGKLTVTTWFRVQIKSPDCPPHYADPVAIQVISTSAPNGRITGTQGVCTLPNTAKLTLSDFTGNVIYWESSSDRWATIRTIANTTSGLTVTNLTLETQFRAVTDSKCGPLRSTIHRVGLSATVNFSVKITFGCESGNIIATTDAIDPVFSITPSLQPPNNTGIFNGLPYSKYTLTMKDAGGCEIDTVINLGSGAPEPPVVFGAGYLSTSTALVAWSRIYGNNVRYNIRYRIKGAEQWTTFYGIGDTTRLLTGLFENTLYEIQVQAKCPNNSIPTNWSQSAEFRTKSDNNFCNRNPLLPPSGVYVYDIQAREAKITWNKVPDAIGYIVSYGPITNNPNSWSQYVVCNPDTIFKMTNLSPNTNYAVRIRTNCTNCTTALKNSDKRSNWVTLLYYRTQTNKNITTSESQLSEVQIFPNPNNGNFYLQWNNIKNENSTNIFTNQEAKILILDALGKKVFEEIIEINTEDVRREYSFKDFSSGLYLIQVFDRNQIDVPHVFKWIKE